MYKKTLLTLLIVLFGTLSYAQIYSYENLFFELYDTEDNIFLEDSISPGWSKTTFGRRVKYEYLTINGQTLLIAYTSVCSGLSCWHIKFFKKNDNRWYLAAKTWSYTPFSPSDSISSYFDTESNDIVIEFDGEILGRLNEDFISGKIPTYQSDNGTVSFINNSVPYIIDIDKHIVYKANSFVDTTLQSTTASSTLLSENGIVFYKGDDNLKTWLGIRQDLKKNVSIGYFNPSESPDKKTIVCEQRICKGKNFKTILLTNIVEIDIRTRIIRVLGKGQNPQYCPTNSRYILYRSNNDKNNFYIFDTESYTDIIGFDAQNAVWLTSNSNN